MHRSPEAVLLKRTLYFAAIAFVTSGAIAAFTRDDPVYARLMLILGLLCAMLFLWLDWRARRH